MSELVSEISSVELAATASPLRVDGYVINMAENPHREVATQSSKPEMEKRRRARINTSLAELKALLLEVIKKEGGRHNKMEKADILELTVKHLRRLQKKQFSASSSADDSLLDKYSMGFSECATQVSRYLSTVEDLDAELRARLLNHLASCVSGISSSTSSSPQAADFVSVSGSSFDPTQSLLSQSHQQATLLFPSGAGPFPIGSQVGTHHLAQHAISTSSSSLSAIRGEISEYIRPSPSVTSLSSIRLQLPYISQSSPGGPLLPRAETLGTDTDTPLSSSSLTYASSFLSPTALNLTYTPVASVTNSPNIAGSLGFPISSFTSVGSVVPSTGATSSSVFSSLQVIPTRLPTGEIAFVVPSGQLAHGHVMPVYPAASALSTPINSKTAPVRPSTISAGAEFGFGAVADVTNTLQNPLLTASSHSRQVTTSPLLQLPPTDSTVNEAIASVSRISLQSVSPMIVAPPTTAYKDPLHQPPPEFTRSTGLYTLASAALLDMSPSQRVPLSCVTPEPSGSRSLTGLGMFPTFFGAPTGPRTPQQQQQQHEEDDIDSESESDDDIETARCRSGSPADMWRPW